jgi:LysR family hydrogen peroxide-inducible transcriptional activator
MKNYPSLRQIQYFLSLCRSLSFSRAAEDCFVTQSTLSAGIKELELLIGKSLVERSSRHVQLTHYGKEFKKEAEKLLHFADQIIDPAARQDNIAGPFYLGMIPTVAPYFAPAFLENIKKQFPKLDCTLDEDLTDHLLEKLRSGRIDSLQKHIYTQDKFILALPKDYDFKGTSITKQALANIDLILLEDGHCLSDHAINACSLNTKLKRQKHNLSSLMSVMSLCQTEKKGTLITEMMLEPLQNMFREFRFVPIESTKPLQREIALVWRNSGPDTHFLQQIKIAK